MERQQDAAISKSALTPVRQAGIIESMLFVVSGTNLVVVVRNPDCSCS